MRLRLQLPDPARPTESPRRRSLPSGSLSLGAETAGGTGGTDVAAAIPDTATLFGPRLDPRHGRIQGVKPRCTD